MERGGGEGGGGVGWKYSTKGELDKKGLGKK